MTPPLRSGVRRTSSTCANDQRWDPWPKVALYVVILVFAGAVVFSAWGGGSLLEAVVFMCVMLTGVLALNVWRRRT